MTRNLPEPLPDGSRKPGESRVFAMARALLEWSNLQRYKGNAYIQVSFNDGGPTDAKAFLEEPLPLKT